jgi:hypothetical protein
MYTGIVTNPAAPPDLSRWRDLLKVKGAVVLVPIEIAPSREPRDAVSLRTPTWSTAFPEDALIVNHFARFFRGDFRAVLVDAPVKPRRR